MAGKTFFEINYDRYRFNVRLFIYKKYNWSIRLSVMWVETI